MKKILKALALCFLVLVGTSIAQAKISIPDQLPHELVSDYAGMLTVGQKAELNAKLRAYYDKTTNVFVVVTIPSIEETGEATLQDWNMKLADTWKPGSAEKSNGLIMTISGKVPPFKVRINPGRGLTGSLTDAYLKRMIEDTMKPVLNAPTNYYQGINVAVDAMAAQVGDEFTHESKPSKSLNDGWVLLALFCGFWLLVFMVLGFGVVMSKSNARAKPSDNTYNRTNSGYRGQSNRPSKSNSETTNYVPSAWSSNNDTSDSGDSDSGSSSFDSGGGFDGGGAGD
jgi:uncharacterized membrane protein YgcG